MNIDVHDCGIIGNLAQSRKRALLIARHTEKIPPFVYQPRHHSLRGVGEVIGKLPLPGDPIAGPMHRIPALQWKTWLRLALVPAGKDWRALNELTVINGQLRDFGIVPETTLRDNALGVSRWTDSAPVITSYRAPGQGRFAVADPRPDEQWHNEALGVRDWTDSGRVVAGASRPHNGAHSGRRPPPRIWKRHAPEHSRRRAIRPTCQGRHVRVPSCRRRALGCRSAPSRRSGHAPPRAWC